LVSRYLRRSWAKRPSTQSRLEALAAPACLNRSTIIAATPTSGLYGAVRDQIYVLHAFHKKSKRGIATPKRDLELIRERLEWAERLHTGKTKKG
jgi:hypothetical protein